MKITYSSINKLQIIVLLFLTFLFPLSRKGSVVSIYGILAVLILSAAALILLFTNKTSRQKIVVSFLMIFYLFIASFLTLTINSNDFHFGYMRFVYLIIVFLFFSSTTRDRVPFSFYEKALDTVMVFVIIGNIIILLNIGNISSFIIDTYTQYLSYITSYQLETKKPILVFGVHNIAAFVYQGILILSYYTYSFYSKKKYLVYSIICIVLLLALRCTTSIGYAMISICYLVYTQTKSFKKLSISISLLVILLYIALSNGWVDIYYGIMSQPTNGLIPRYLTGMHDLFGGNLQVVKDSWFGIGFCVPDDPNKIYGADSGFIISLTIGRYFYAVAFYVFLWNYIKTSLSRKIAIVVYVYMLLMELGFITFLYFRSIAFFIFVIYYLSSLEKSI